MKSLIIVGALLTSTLSFADTGTVSALSFLTKHSDNCNKSLVKYQCKMKNFNKSDVHFTQYKCHQTAIQLVEDLTGQPAIAKNSRISLSSLNLYLDKNCDEAFAYDSNSPMEVAYANFGCKDAASKTINYFLEEGLANAIKYSEMVNERIKDSEEAKTIQTRRQQDKRISTKEREEFKKAIRAN